jgi:hypothetical protein
MLTPCLSGGIEPVFVDIDQEFVYFIGLVPEIALIEGNPIEDFFG